MAKKIPSVFGRLTRNLAKFDATFPQIVFAQLIADGFEPREAVWVCFYAFDKNVGEDKLEERAKNVMSIGKVQELIDYFKREMRTPSVDSSTDEDGTPEFGADATAAELLRIANTLPDGKERADLMMKYADLRGFKKAGNDTKVDKKSVAFFLPVQCTTCPCKEFAFAHGEEKDKQPLHSSRK